MLLTHSYQMIVWFAKVRKYLSLQLFATEACIHNTVCMAAGVREQLNTTVSSKCLQVISHLHLLAR